MKIIWFTWKDIKNPLAGGAEVVASEIGKRLVKDGHEVIFLTAGFKDAKSEECIDGYKIIRLGNRWSVYFKVAQFYKKNLNGWADVIIEEINTIPFFTQSFVKEKRRYLFFHQLCREIWFYQMAFPLSFIGYLIEPMYLRSLQKNKVITVSESTRKDLIRFGFLKKSIKIISEGIVMEPVRDLAKIKKYKNFTVLSFGAIRPMKRTLEQIKAFEIARKKVPGLRMKIAGSGKGSYFDKVIKYVNKSYCSDDIEYLGRVTQEEKIGLMQRSHVILVTSVKEGWGLIVTEANSQGTPAIVYNVDGLRDSVRNSRTGFVTSRNNPESLARSIIELCQDQKTLDKFQSAALKWSKEITFDQTYIEFMKAIQ